MYAEGASFAGLLLEKSGLAQAYPNTKLETLTASPPWAFPVTWVAGTEDSVFPIAQARLEKGLLQRAGHPLQFLEVPDDHSGKSDPNWQKTLLPAMSSWVTPLPSQ